MQLLGYPGVVTSRPTRIEFLRSTGVSRDRAVGDMEVIREAHDRTADRIRLRRLVAAQRGVDDGLLPVDVDDAAAGSRGVVDHRAVDDRVGAAPAQGRDPAGSYFTRILRLSFLAPEILQAILRNRHPIELTATRLANEIRLPVAWDAQRTLLGVG